MTYCVGVKVIEVILLWLFGRCLIIHELRCALLPMVWVIVSRSLLFHSQCVLLSAWWGGLRWRFHHCDLFLSCPSSCSYHFYRGSGRSCWLFMCFSGWDRHGCGNRGSEARLNRRLLSCNFNGSLWRYDQSSWWSCLLLFKSDGCFGRRCTTLMLWCDNTLIVDRGVGRHSLARWFFRLYLAMFIEHAHRRLKIWELDRI